MVYFKIFTQIPLQLLFYLHAELTIWLVCQGTVCTGVFRWVGVGKILPQSCTKTLIKSNDM